MAWTNATSKLASSGVINLSDHCKEVNFVLLYNVVLIVMLYCSSELCKVIWCGFVLDVPLYKWTSLCHLMFLFEMLYCSSEITRFMTLFLWSSNSHEIVSIKFNAIVRFIRLFLWSSMRLFNEIVSMKFSQIVQMT